MKIYKKGVAKMEEKKTGFLQWVKANRKQLIIAGVSIAVPLLSGLF